VTVFSLETENGWRLEVTILSGMGVACSADSTVGGISEPSAMIKNKHDLAQEHKCVKRPDAALPSPCSKIFPIFSNMF
jgi:hypothetical protein